jgi:undecaprenyl diphosphate synthase
MVYAAQQAAAEGRPVDAAAIDHHLYLPELPVVDVMVRTSGEIRVSNFMLWQSAGTQVYFTEHPWPEFDADDLDAALSLIP